MYMPKRGFLVSLFAAVLQFLVYHACAVIDIREGDGGKAERGKQHNKADVKIKQEEKETEHQKASQKHQDAPWKMPHRKL